MGKRKAGAGGAAGMRWLRGISELYLGLLLSVFLLWAGPYERITQVKYALFLWICGGYVLLTLLSLLELLAVGQLPGRLPGQRLRENRWILSALGLWLACSVLAALCSPYDYNIWLGMSRYEGLLTQMIYGATACCLILFGRLRRWHLHLFGGTMVLFCGLGILQLMGRNPLGLYPAGYDFYGGGVYYGGQYLGTIGNADLSAALLAVAVLVFGAWLLAGTGKDRLWVILPFGLCLGVLLRLRVAAGLVAAALGLAMLLPLGLWVRGNKKGWKIALIAEGVLGALALLLLFFRDFGGSGTLWELHCLLHGQVQADFGSGRIRIWSEILRELPHHLLLGTGPDTLAAWGLEGFSAYKEAVGAVVHAGIDTAHCELLHMAAQAGLPAALIFGALPVLAILRFARSHEKKKLLIPLAGLGAYCIQALFSFSMCMTAPLYWAMLGLVFAGEERKS